MSNSRPKLPISFIKKNKDEAVLTKYLAKPVIMKPNSDNFCEEDEIKNKAHGCNRRRKEERKTSIIEDDEMFSNIEYTKIVVKALKEALEENENVSIL
jgi:hypothetical protein